MDADLERFEMENMIRKEERVSDPFNSFVPICLRFERQCDQENSSMTSWIVGAFFTNGW